MKLGPRLGVVLWLACVAGLSGCATAPGETPLAAGGASTDASGRAAKLLEMGDLAAAGGDSRTAIGYYQQAAGMGATDPVALNRIGEALLGQRRWQDAADVFRRVLTLSPADASAHRGYARALLALDQPGPATAHLEEALRTTPDDARTLNMLGVAYDMMGRGGDALVLYRRGLEAAPGDPSMVNNLGLSYALAGDFEAAIAQLEPLANGPASTARARQNLALVYGLKGDALAAERIGRLDLDPASVRGNMAFVAALRAAGDPAASAAALITDIAVDPAPTGPRRTADARRPTSGPLPKAPAELPATGPSPVEGSPMPLTAAAADSVAAMRSSAAVSNAPLWPDEPAGSDEDLPDLPVTPAALALTETDIVSGLAPTGGWLVELGSFDDRSAALAAWRQLRSAHADLIGGMTRLAGVESGPQPLLAGPLASESEADRVCRGLAARGVSCGKLQV